MPKLIVRQRASLLDISIGSTHIPLSIELGLPRVYVWWILHLFSSQQKTVSVKVCQYLMEQVVNEVDYLNNIITTDKTWIYCYNPMFKQQTSKLVLRGSSHLLKPLATKLKIKCMVITFFDQKGLVYTRAVPDSQTVNADWYVEVQKRLFTVHIPCKRPHYCNGQWKLYQDNARSHVAQCIWGFLTSHGVEVTPHTLYSPDLVSTDFFLFPTGKRTSRVVILNLHRQR